jgi:hypothetical protein
MLSCAAPFFKVSPGKMMVLGSRIEGSLFSSVPATAIPAQHEEL